MIGVSEEQKNLSLTDQAAQKIYFGENLINAIEEFKNIEGSQKLCRKINQELKFLKKVLKNNQLKKEHLQCSNLTHFAALINVLKTVENCKSVNKVFLLNDKKVTVDIVSDGGLTWTKVIARNPKSVSQICMGNASYGVRSIIDQAEEFSECAKFQPCLFQTPKIIFIFTNGVSHNIASKLETYGITVKGTRLEDLNEIDEDDVDFSDTDDEAQEYNTDNLSGITELSTNNVSSISKVNLDVSAMLAYCSSVTNGSAAIYDFEVPVLKQQAAWERLRPQKHILEDFFKDKKLYCCQTAKDNFENIVKTVGGPNENVRAKELLERLVVLPDDADYRSTSENDQFNEVFNKVQYTNDSLKVGGKIRQRSLTIFTFGDRIRAVTVSANEGFVRAARQQGVNFVVFIHESRALTEQKEKTKAIPIAK
ncbi:UPF0415 protein C7orf25 homolog [Anoplophora glabripennis]|uniref:UPF0415 protein C7orf25 homolog n=1 Tax=Anoplophora glabripennis TaxID=217634 RepID=UPI0008741FFA|nr:UPF0415 protein C7orf25 homolog [Anoplophora glabripennis]